MAYHNYLLDLVDSWSEGCWAVAYPRSLFLGIVVYPVTCKPRHVWSSSLVDFEKKNREKEGAKFFSMKKHVKKVEGRKVSLWKLKGDPFACCPGFLFARKMRWWLRQSLNDDGLVTFFFGFSATGRRRQRLYFITSLIHVSRSKSPLRCL